MKPLPYRITSRSGAVLRQDAESGEETLGMIDVFVIPPKLIGNSCRESGMRIKGQTETELDALMPSILSEAFSGDH